MKLRASKKIILNVWSEFTAIFGRQYSPVEKYHSDKAKVLLLTMGSFSETAMETVDKMRAEGKDVGLIRLRLWRPFPLEEFLDAVKDADTLVVLDRAISFGGPGGPVCSEVKSALYSETKKPKVASIVSGLGGRDITVSQFEDIINRGIELAQNGVQRESEIMGVRE
jgi:pyruvate ferredoxin oxidoreductase alpha subunit